MAAAVAMSGDCQTPSSRLRSTGVALIGGRPGGTIPRGQGYDQFLGGLGHGSLGRPVSSASSRSSRAVDYGPPPPPSGRTGLMHSSSAPSMEFRSSFAENVPAMKNVRAQRFNAQPEPLPKNVWSDSCSHLPNEEPWPQHAVPLWVFTGTDRPRPAYREQVRFKLTGEKYVNFATRLRCGKGDHYMGGAVGIVYSPDRTETVPGTDGQLIMVTDVVTMPDQSAVVTCVGDLEFVVQHSWIPRGLNGLQMATITAKNSAPRLETIAEACLAEPTMTIFGRMLAAVPALAETLNKPGAYTVFAPTDEALFALGISEEELLQRPDLDALVSAHFCPGKVNCEAMYSGRTMRSYDGTILQLAFARWPRAGPSVNDVPIEHMDIPCSNGVIHSIVGMLGSSPAPSRRRR
eukprot:TRINITY_DN92022_c0_g1_i1.p1 TRINITY_DN92022_c0_g1~~TRINITY_DN92022_c0_g1_i1.p1  ORF type:complete len:404 (+),score=68.39 TRINITY_DN92022_c0_g1_i1:178-1389(+)